MKGQTYLWQKPFCLDDTRTHTMGDSLVRYLGIKVHQYVDEKKYERIDVVGDYDRDSAVLSRKEKTDKQWNWQRPTATVKNGVLTIRCYPGQDYVRHYAALLSTYLSLTGRSASSVRYRLPSEDDCWKPLLRSRLSNLRVHDTVVLGVELRRIFEDVEWKHDSPILYGVYNGLRSSRTTLLMVEHSFWGDIAGRLTRLLAQRGAKRIVFVGKLGSLNPRHVPNTIMATGNRTVVEGEAISWKNHFAGISDGCLRRGGHVTVPSVLFETRSWLKTALGLYAFVDPEIGHMARAAIRAGIEFSYLHIVSDNVAKKFSEDLSNERDLIIREKRDRLFNHARRILQAVV